MNQTSPRIMRDVSDVDVMFPAAARAAREYLRANRRPLALTLRPYSPPRNNEQNARLWWLHGLMAAYLNARLPELHASGQLPRLFQQFTAEAVHEGIFKPKYCGTRTDGTPRSSTRLSKLDFAEALTRYEADMANEGVEIPTDELNADGWR